MRRSVRSLVCRRKKTGCCIQRDIEDLCRQPGVSVDDFLKSISTPTPEPNLALPRYRTASLEQAEEFVEQLNRSGLDTRAIRGIITKLSSPQHVRTATLVLVANKFLQNTCTYRDRKTAIKAITKGLSEKPVPNLVRGQNTANGSEPA